MTKEITEDRGDLVEQDDETLQGGQTDDTVDLKDEKAEAGSDGDKKVVADAEEKVEADGKDDADAEVEEDGEDGEKDAKSKKIYIPKERFDSAVKKARLAEEAAVKRAEALETQLKAQQGKVDAEKIDKEIDELSDKLDDAVRDGVKEEAKRLRAEIRAKTQMLADARAEVKAQYATAMAVEQIRYNALVDRMEIEHPELNPDNEDTFDEELVAEVSELKTAFEKSGLSSSESLSKALKAVYRNGPKPADEKKVDAKDKADDRKADSVAKGLDTKKKQPPGPGIKAGASSDKAGKKEASLNVGRMSDKEFDKLPEDERKRARGDTL